VTGPNGLRRDSGGEFLFSGSRDGTLKRWELGVDGAVCGATFESHVDWVFFFTIILQIAIISSLL
jgi:WD repeat-containing protein 48